MHAALGLGRGRRSDERWPRWCRRAALLAACSLLVPTLSRAQFCDFQEVYPPEGPLPAMFLGQPSYISLCAIGFDIYPGDFELVQGTLPPGIALTSGTYNGCQIYGALEGVPTSLGTWSFILRPFAQYCGPGPEMSYTLPVYLSCGMTLGPPVLPPATPGVAYQVQLTAGGGQPPYTFWLDGPAVPPGLSLAPSGLLSGTPTQVGTFPFRIGVNDAASCATTAAYSLAVGCLPVKVSPPVLPDAARGHQYDVSFSASGGQAPFTYAVVSGVLPPGISFWSGGSLNGVPTALGRYPLDIDVRSSAGCAGTRISVDLVVRDSVGLLAGAGHGAANPNLVKALDNQGTVGLTVQPYGAATWGANVGRGDVYGTFTDVGLTGPGPGPGLGSHVRAFRRSGLFVPRISFLAYPTPGYGVGVAGAFIDGDRFDEILVGRGPGAGFGPHVRAFDFDGVAIQAVANVNYYAYYSATNGVTVRGGDADADGYAEILTAPGPCTGCPSRVRGFDYDGQRVAILTGFDFDAFPAVLRGAHLDGGDVDLDGFSDVVVTPGPGATAAHVGRLAGFSWDGAGVSPLPACDVVAFGSLYGGRVATSNVYTVSPAPDPVIGRGPDPAAAAELRVYYYTRSSGLQPVTSLQPFALGYGVNVAASHMGF